MCKCVYVSYCSAQHCVKLEEVGRERGEVEGRWRRECEEWRERVERAEEREKEKAEELSCAQEKLACMTQEKTGIYIASSVHTITCLQGVQWNNGDSPMFAPISEVACLEVAWKHMPYLLHLFRPKFALKKWWRLYMHPLPDTGLLYKYVFVVCVLLSRLRCNRSPLYKCIIHCCAPGSVTA